MRCRLGAGLVGAVLALAPLAATAQTATAPKVLRYAFRVAETSLDPAKVNDTYSKTLIPHILEAPYRFDHLARPVKLKPLTADGLPQASDDFRTWTVKIRPGIYFADDPAFKGQRRELVAQDYVYAFKRFADPANKSPIWSSIATDKYLGLNELRQASLDRRQPFDYDREIEGVRAPDRYTLQFKVADPRPRFAEGLAGSDVIGAVAREVVEFYGDAIDAHPVGTGPFRLAEWRRSSRIVLERNPQFRELLYDAEPAVDDAEGQALLARFKGRRLPMIDRVEISIVEQEQPRWLSFLGGEADFMERVGFEFIDTAMPDGKLAPHLVKRGMQAWRRLETGNTYLYFNMEHPTVGGYTPEQVALRRAIGLAMDIPREIRLLRHGQGVLTQSPIAPYTSAYDPAYRSEFGDFDPARAQGLLDLYGYLDRDGDGLRERPDGSPLLLELASQPDASSRALDELTTRNLAAIGVRVKLRIAQWPENLKAARAGGLMMWSLAGASKSADSQSALARYDSKQIGGQNMARFRLPAFDAIYAQMESMPDGPERSALFDQANRLAVAYMPYKFRLTRVLTDMAYPWLVGYRRPVFWNEWWMYVDIDPALRPAR